MQITPKFYKREAKNFVPGNIAFRSMSTNPDVVRMFVREKDDTAFPSRICVEMTRSELRSMIHAIQIEFPWLESELSK
jgi:hypothetical protein